MTILGKLLAIANVVAAVGFLYLVAADWALRHKWTYDVYRHDLMLTGLPLDENDTDPTDDEPQAEKLNEKTLQAIFQQAGGTPVKTQREEVKNAQTQFNGTINGSAD